MTAGKGVQHSEMFPLIYKEKENPLEIFQVWLNLPKASKFVEPHFKMLWGEDVPVIKQQDQNGKTVQVEVVAGNVGDIQALDPTPDSWAANPDNHVLILTIKLEAGATWTLPKGNDGVNRTLYFYKGNVMKIEGNVIPSNHSIQVHPEVDVTMEAGEEDCYLLVLQGKPINEPVAQHGPFVMNTQAEINEAFEEYQRTQFGGWPWPEREQAHARDKGRFALYADGREELKG
jgi:redox-sensitive bicupin YhaK (pirin superfamily)